MVDIVVGLILCAVIGAAGRYLYRAKKKGVACVGCSCGGSCGGCGGSCGGCGHSKD